jgi:hypothetical protein
MDKEYHRRYNRERYHQLRAEYIVQLGGVCSDCGIAEDLEFHHTDPDSKLFSIGNLLGYSRAAVDAEVAKCVLRCASCARIRGIGTGNIKTVDHGGGVSGKHNCPCVPCKTRKAEYMRNYNRDYKRMYRNI